MQDAADGDATGVENAGKREAPAQLLAADDPIQDPEDDRLERAPFARMLAATVRRAPRRAGFVIGVTGPWGDGKTSVLNMTASYVERDGIAEVVEFNPWLFSGTEQLVERFFAEIAGQVNADNGERQARISNALRRYGQIVGPLRFLPGIGRAFELSSQVASGASQVLGEAVPTVHERKRELSEALADLSRPILITVDDLDRLRPEEVVDVVRLVRLVGDFPNLIYLLAFEQRRVEEALGGNDRERGRAYLEKIVQVAHGLPPVRSDLFDGLLNEALGEAVGDLSRLRFDRGLFTNYYADGLRSLFRNLRDIRRYSNVLPATVAMIEDEVELADVIALEALRAFEPESFGLIVTQQDAVTNIGDRPGRDTAAQQTAAQVQAIVDAAARPDIVEALVKRLFPGVERHFGGSHYAHDFLTSWRRNRRVAHPEVLSIYVSRSLPPGVLPARTVEALVGLLDNREALQALVDELDSDGLERLFSRLEDYEGEFNLQSPEVPVEVFLNARAKLRKDRRGMFDMGAELALNRIVLRLLRGLPQEEAERIVRAVSVNTLSGSADLVSLVGHRDGVGFKLVSEQVAEELETQLADTVVEADAGALIQEPELGRLLALAREKQPELLRERLRRLIRDEEFLVALLRAYVSEVLGQTVGEAAVRRTYRLLWPPLADTIGQTELAEAVRAIADDRPRPDEDEQTAFAIEQARRYAEDPDAAQRDRERWEGQQPE